MNVASCGLGVNSIAGIIEATNKGIIFDEILFANTGDGNELGERKVTYEYLEKYFAPYLIKHRQPEIKILHSVNADGNRITLYEECFKLKTLPAIVFGFKTCSQRFKIAPQDKYLNNHPDCKEAWKAGQKVTKWIFYDADEPERAKDYTDSKFDLKYFLIENDIGRYECEQIINNADLPLPPKSSCKFCPSMKPYQIIELYENSPEDFFETIDLERNALQGGRMLNIAGLGRDYSWWDLIIAYRYFRFFKKANKIQPINPKILKLIHKIRRSKPKKLTPKKVCNANSGALIQELFAINTDIPCGCYD